MALSRAAVSACELLLWFVRNRSRRCRRRQIGCTRHVYSQTRRHVQLEALGRASGREGARGYSWRTPTGDVAADESASDLMGNVHHDEAAGGGIDNEISRLGDGSDQPSDQVGWLCVRVDSAIDLLDPPVRDSVIVPCRLRAHRWLLQDEQVAAAPPAAIAVARPQVVPGDQIDALDDIGDARWWAPSQRRKVSPHCMR